MPGLIEVLDEQAVFGFTGRINIVLKSNRQYFGAITQKDGLIVDAQFKKLHGKKALFSLLIEDLSSDTYQYIVEPELVEEKDCTMSLSLKELKKQGAHIYQQFQASQKLKPPGDLRLMINSGFIVDGPSVTADEFQVLATLTEFSRVSDVYKHSSLLDYETTNSLVSLRKKGALRVFKNP